MKKNLFLTTFIAASFLLSLSGCSGGSFMEEARKGDKLNPLQQNQEELIEEENQKERDELYKDLERPIEEVVDENQKDIVSIQNQSEIIERGYYNDPNEFARYVGKFLYEFYTLAINPEDYYEFLMKYGSELTKEEIPSREDAITVYTAIQEMFRQQNIKGESYEITEVVLDRFARSGYFYRKLNTTNGVEYFITTITLEEKGWAFVEDSPSPPFEEGEENTTKEQESNIEDSSNENVEE